MKTFLMLPLVLALFAGNLCAQAPDPNDQTHNDPDIQASRSVAIEFLDAMYAKDFEQAIAMMNPDPPFWKGSKNELKDHREKYLKSRIESREAYGPPLDRHLGYQRKGRLSERPATEQFYEFVFEYTFPDGRTATDKVTIMKKDGKYYVERLR